MAPEALEHLLTEIPPFPPALESRVLAGRARNEDAAVVSFPSGVALVQTVDILSPLVNDPKGFGRIAAANALSDVYAMGGTPWSVLNIACFPEALAKHDPEGVLAAILAGSAETVAEAEAIVVGGHTLMDSEIKFGLAVSGIVSPTHIAKNSGLRPGLALLLTKPLGTGILATAIKAQWEGAEASEALLLHWCGRLNNHAGAAITQFLLPAATDITGFGLGGHALEMATASHVSIVLEASQLPLFDGVIDYARNGLIPSGSHANRCYYTQATQKDVALDAVLETVIFDVQTSGGLLLGVPHDRISEVQSFLEESGELAVYVGEVIPATEGQAPLIIHA